MNKKFMSVPIMYSESSVLQSDDIKIPVEIMVMHDKVNLNKSNFEMEVIESAKESIKNIPILAYVRKIDGSDSKDFAGHEMELSVKDGELKFIYLERPVGVIPETNNYEYVEVEGKTYVKVIGYLWKEYLNDAYEILQENPNKSVSMEITVDDYDINKDGVFNIKAYRYLGVTILGDAVKPGMEGANMQVLGQFSEKFSEDFYKKVEKLNNELKQFEFQNDNMNGGEKEKMKNTENNTSNPTTQPVAFSATYKQKREALNNALDPIVVKDEDGNYISETYFYVEDFDDTYVMVEKNYWDSNGYECTYGRYTYSFDEVSLTATITSEFEKMVKVWLTEEENQKIQTERQSSEQMKADYETLKLEVENYKETISNFESEKESLNIKINDYEKIVSEKDVLITELETYKSNNELEIKKSQIEDLISEFESVLGENEEFKTICKNAMEYDVETLEKELYALVGKVKYTKSKTTKKTTVASKVSVEGATQQNYSYYGDMSKYIPSK